MGNRKFMGGNSKTSQSALGIYFVRFCCYAQETEAVYAMHSVLYSPVHLVSLKDSCSLADRNSFHKTKYSAVFESLYED